MINIITLLIILLLFGSAITYIIKAKKKGVKCIGCSAAGQCAAAKTSKDPGTGCSSCHGCDLSYEEIKSQTENN